MAAHDTGAEVLLYAREQEVVSEINDNNSNTRYLDKDVKVLPKATNDLKEALEFSDVVLCATPLKFLRSTLRSFKEVNIIPRKIINVSKGFEPDTGKLPNEIIKEELPTVKPVTLTGPSHAESLAVKGYTAVMLLSEDTSDLEEVANMFRSSYFRIYTDNDIVGGEIYGAAKNVYAIGAGMMDAAGATDNTKAAYITRALHELNILGKSFGAKDETIFSLAGVGDLIVTAFSFNSRNYSYGYNLIKGGDMPTTTVEGLNTVDTLKIVSDNKGIEMPIATAIKAVLDNKISVDDAIERLMGRDQ
jgi:glycerol-3-phosphate dehydrogenase (NAD(P)+)